MHSELARLFRELRRESEARAIVLTARGKTFSAGGDFGWFSQINDGAAIEEVRRDGKQIIWDLLDVRIPIVTHSITVPPSGSAPRSRCSADVVFMADTASLADPHVRVGHRRPATAAPRSGPWPCSARLAGAGQESYHLLTGDPGHRPTDAEPMGLAHPGRSGHARLREEAPTSLRRLAAEGPASHQGTPRLPSTSWSRTPSTRPSATPPGGRGCPVAARIQGSPGAGHPPAARSRISRGDRARQMDLIPGLVVARRDAPLYR